MKDEKFAKLKDAVEEFIAVHELSNPHYLRDEVIVKAFSEHKEKNVKKAIKEVR
jgi:hypothetical protein